MLDIPTGDTRLNYTIDDSPTHLSNEPQNDHAEPGSKKRKRKEREEEAKTDDIESRYITKIYSQVSKLHEPTNKEPFTSERLLPSEPDPVQAEEDIDPALVQHEALNPQSIAAEKTIFISNLPVKVLTSKPHLRLLKTLFSSHGRIESIRFRSIAFSELGPRKVAFITKKLHPERDTLNAYIVYSSEESVSAAMQALNGYVWEGKHLRVDSVAKPAVISLCYFLLM